MDERKTISTEALRNAIQALAEGGKEVSYALIYDALGITLEEEKDVVRSRVTSMVKHGEITRTERGSFIYNFKRKARKAAGYETIWRFVRAAKPGWSYEDCAMMTHQSYSHVCRYVQWLSDEGFVERCGRNEKNTITYCNTGKARQTPETPYPPIRETDPFERERVAAAAITRLMLCADPYAVKTGRQICEACRVLLARFEKNTAEIRTENENGEDCDVE